MQGHRFNEICVDYEFWTYDYGGNTTPNTFPYADDGWNYLDDLTVEVENDIAAMYIDTISVMLGHIDRDIDNNSTNGFFGDGDDYEVIADYADDHFDRIYLFFYLEDKIPIDPDFDPTFFLTSTINRYIALKDRLAIFGKNTTASQIWPSFSAEGVATVNNYLGYWLQGTGGWAQEHYFTDAQNIFVEQYINDFVPYANSLISGWLESIDIYGYAIFRYGLEPIYAFRAGDAKYNIDLCIAADRVAYNYTFEESNFPQNEVLSETQFINKFGIIKYELYDITGRQINIDGSNALINQKNLLPGVYFVKKFYENKTEIVKVFLE